MLSFPQLYILVISITINYFLGFGGVNYLLVCFLVIASIRALANAKKFIFQKDNVLMISLLLWITLVSLINNYSSFRISTIAYTSLFVLGFIYIKEYISTDIIDATWLRKTFKGILYAYTIVLIIQQICVVVGLPVFNQIAVYIEESKFKLPSLCPEPSHLAPMMVFLLYGYILLTEYLNGNKYTLKHIKQDRIVWMSYLWVMLSAYSTTTLLYSILPFLHLVSRKSIFRLLISGCVVFYLLSLVLSQSSAFNRALDIIPAVISFDISTISSVDHSAAYRLVPPIYYIQNFDIFSYYTWFGEGIDAGKNMFNNVMFEISNDVTYGVDSVVNIGGLANFIIDYGLISLILLVFSFKNIIFRTKDKVLVSIWCINTVFVGINMQIFWFSVLTLLIASKYSLTDSKKANSIKA